MLTFKRSVILLVSIITILAIIAVGTGLSPLYWPFSNNLKEDDSSIILTTKTTHSLTLKMQLTTRFKPVPKKYDQLTTTQLVTTLPKTTYLVPVNATFIQNVTNL